jgi:hypothetical protein
MRFLLFNLEDFFIQAPPVDHIVDLSEMNEAEWRLWNGNKCVKSLQHIREIARIILDTQPDVALLIEVGGASALEFFNRHFLGGAYEVFLASGNSGRGIDVGYLLHKRTGLNATLKSYAARGLSAYKKSTLGNAEIIEAVDALFGQGEVRFSRDVSQLEFYKVNDLLQPALIVLLTHFKSQRPDGSVDKHGRAKRWIEFCELKLIVAELQEQYCHQVPIVIGGDFNGSMRKSSPDTEFASIGELNWQDVFDLEKVPLIKRYTRIGRTGRNQTPATQLDYVFLNIHAAELYSQGSARVIPHLNRHGFAVGPKVNKSQRSAMCSDHFPIVFDLKF